MSAMRLGAMEMDIVSTIRTLPMDGNVCAIVVGMERTVRTSTLLAKAVGSPVS